MFSLDTYLFFVSIFCVCLSSQIWAHQTVFYIWWIITELQIVFRGILWNSKPGFWTYSYQSPNIVIFITLWSVSYNIILKIGERYKQFAHHWYLLKIFYIFRENLKTKDEKEKDKYRYAPLDCKVGGPHCRKFSRQKDASLHFKLYHSKYHSEVCEKCKRRFETHSELRTHQKKCDPG